MIHAAYQEDIRDPELVFLVSATQTTKDRTPDRGVQSWDFVSSAVRSHPDNVRAS